MVDCAAANLGSTPVHRVRLLLLVPATALAVAACGSSTTTGSGAPAGTTPTGAAPAAATTSAAPEDNGVSALSAEQILTKAKTALGAANAVHIKGTGVDDDGTVKIDMRYGPDGAVGSFIVSGQRLDLRRVGEVVYIKGDASFWTTFANASVAKLLGGKYVKTSLTDDDLGDLAAATDLSASVDDFLEPDGTISKGGPTTIAGQPAIGLVSKDKTDGTLYVATTGRPYPLSVEGGGNSVTFTGYGEALTVTAPPAAEVVDQSVLPGS